VRRWCALRLSFIRCLLLPVILPAIPLVIPPQWLQRTPLAPIFAAFRDAAPALESHLLTVLTVLGATAYFIMSKPAVFQRTATLQVLPASDSRSENASDLDVLTSGISQSRTIETQLAILKSSPVQVGAYKRLSQASKQALSKYVELGIEAVGRYRLDRNCRLEL
jgi:hypothetical protein